MKRTPILPFFLVAALLGQTAGAGVDLPDLGDVSQVSMTAADEARIGREAMTQLRQQNAISDDLELDAYINTLGSRLASAVPPSGIKFTFFVVNDASINAFAMPGGYVGVNKGLILATQSEGELASVLGHEMAHVTQHHIARMQAQSVSTQLTLLATLVATVLASRSGNSDAAIGAVNAGVGLTVANQLSFSRDYEREADRVGMQYLEAAGFDVRDMPSFFQRLQQSEHLNGGDAYAFLRTHPVTVERISEAQDRALEAPVRMRESSTSYLLVREKIRAQLLPSGNDAVKYYKNALDRRLFLSEGATWYGMARARMRVRDFTGARQALAQARKLLPVNPMLEDLDAAIGEASGDWTRALASYRAGLVRFPDSRILANGEIDALLQTGQRPAALKEINAQRARYPNDPALFRLLSRVYADADMLRFHDALGNALYFEGQYDAALEQYHLASQSPGSDFYLRSSIEARIRELEKTQAAGKKAGKPPAGNQ
jgi:beta-barrel assembly-enhancing protease